MTFTDDEKRLLTIYYSDTLAETTETFRLALRDAIDSDEHAVITSVLQKISGIDEDAFDGLDIASEGLYG